MIEVTLVFNILKTFNEYFKKWNLSDGNDRRPTRVQHKFT